MSARKNQVFGAEGCNGYEVLRFHNSFCVSKKFIQKIVIKKHCELGVQLFLCGQEESAICKLSADFSPQSINLRKRALVKENFQSIKGFNF